MTEQTAQIWLTRAPKEAIAYVRATAATYLAARGTITDPLTYDDASRDAFVMAVSLAARFWSPERP